MHRCMALVLAALILGFWFALQRSQGEHARTSRNLMLLALLVQFGLGVSTLLYVVPVPLAVAHQGGALLLFSLILLVNHQLFRTPGRDALR
jgi:cytochrome c oxidase assembly protein subunit 15